MKCPYSDCRKDYNDEWPKIVDSWLTPKELGGSVHDRQFYNRLYVITRRCRFCQQLFHEVYVGHENFDAKNSWEELQSTLEPLATFPVAQSKFEAKTVPSKVLKAFQEAERCRSVGSLTGAGGCLRKAVYALCDDRKAVGRDYKEKIVDLPVDDKYKELLKQIKWLGDSVTKPGEETYTMEMVDVAMEILPVIVDDIYLKEEEIDKASKLLAKARTTAKQPAKR